MEFLCGDRIKHPAKPGWGPGEVLQINDHKIHAYFVWGGLRILNCQVVDLIKASGEEAESLVLDAISKVGNWNNAHHSVYVIGLTSHVLNDGLFKMRNPNWVAGMPCVYVGMTGLKVEERFQRHMDRIKAGRGYAHLYGTHLLYDLFEHLNPMPYCIASAMEVELARKLQSMGYGVWQN